MTLSFFVEKQKITRTDTETPAANSDCYLKAKFEFGNDWDVSSSVCPIFRRGGEDSGYMPKLTNGSFLDEQNICFVPIEVLNKEGRFFVSIFDYKNGKTITTNEAMVEVCRSGPVFNSPTIYSLDLRFENENLQLTANGEAVGAGVELPKQEIDNMMSDTSENPVQNKVAKAYTDEKTRATPTDISLNGNLLQLTANGKAVGEGVEIPKQEIDDAMSDTSENPVQNKVAKAYTDEKTKATPTDISLTGNLLQLTANGKAVGAGVTIQSGLRLINRITVADGETATMLKISKDVDGASFSLQNIMFAARLNLPSAQTVTIRLRTDGGGRYLVFKTGVQASEVLFVSGESKVFSIGTNTNAEYITSNVDLIGSTIGTAFQTFAANAISKTNISDIEIFLYDASNNFVELQAGTSLEVWGC